MLTIVSPKVRLEPLTKEAEVIFNCAVTSVPVVARRVLTVALLSLAVVAWRLLASLLAFYVRVSI